MSKKFLPSRKSTQTMQNPMLIEDHRFFFSLEDEVKGAYFRGRNSLPAPCLGDFDEERPAQTAIGMNFLK
jgi:hypothetical protein